jgi:Holliday junction resolvasome RuvABC endonuclease subunit
MYMMVKRLTLILGIDIGFRNTGWVIAELKGVDLTVATCGCIHTEKSKEKKFRVSEDDAKTNQIIYRELLTIIKNNKVDKIAIELPHTGAKSAAAMKSMSMASAVAACVCESSGLPYIYITPNEVKRVIAGEIRKVEKDEIMEWVQKKYNTTVFPKAKKDFEHIADALVVLEAAINNGKLTE